MICPTWVAGANNYMKRPEKQGFSPSLDRPCVTFFFLRAQTFCSSVPFICIPRVILSFHLFALLIYQWLFVLALDHLPFLYALLLSCRMKGWPSLTDLGTPGSDPAPGQPTSHVHISRAVVPLDLCSVLPLFVLSPLPLAK